jgi:DNA-binding transcriptional ArsR family regulator
MQDENTEPPDMDRQIRRALSHLQRADIVGYLLQRKDGTGTSEPELAAALGLGIRIVEYHLKVLHGTGLTAHVDDETGGAERVVAVAEAGR